MFNDLKFFFEKIKIAIKNIYKKIAEKITDNDNLYKSNKKVKILIEKNSEKV